MERIFGCRNGDDLWTHDGRHIGHFHGDEVYDRQGHYLGEIMGDNRLITHQSKKGSRRASFSPQMSRVGRVPYVSYVGYVMYVGHEDFPDPKDLP